MSQNMAAAAIVIAIIFSMTSCIISDNYYQWKRLELMQKAADRVSLDD